MSLESELEADERDRRNAEIARIAKELAGYGFYVMGTLLPEENPANPQTRASTPSGTTTRL